MDFRGWGSKAFGVKGPARAARGTREEHARALRKLKREAVEASSRQRPKKTLERYVALESLEPSEPGWSRRVGEVYRQLGRAEESVEAFERAAHKYVARGLPTKATALCRAILRVRPGHEGARGLLARLEPAGPARVAGAGPRRAAREPRVADTFSP